jgi:Fe-S-cluster formation regulator IscX/YfhJ
MEHNKSPLASAYLRFLQLARVVQALPEGMQMDANERALLEAVVLRWHESSPMTVREAIALSQLGHAQHSESGRGPPRQIPDPDTAHP